MSERAGSVLLIGYGNPGRLDDGLGPALAEAFEAEGLPGVAVEADYQLTVEDAEAAARHDVVVFADASVSAAEPFEFTEVAPRGKTVDFTSHHSDPEAVLALAHGLFAARARGYALAIRGYQFNEFGERLSPRARANLAAAVEFLRPLLQDEAFCRGRAAPDPVAPPASQRG